MNILSLFEFDRFGPEEQGFYTPEHIASVRNNIVDFNVHVLGSLEGVVFPADNINDDLVEPKIGPQPVSRPITRAVVGIAGSQENNREIAMRQARETIEGLELAS